MDNIPSTSSDPFPCLPGIVDRITLREDRARLPVLLTEAALCLGAESAYYLSAVWEGAALVARHYVVACDPRWASAYEETGSYRHDPWLRHARTRSEPILARDIRVEGEPEHAVVSLAQRHGFASALLLPAPGPAGSSRQGLLVLGSSAAGAFGGDDSSVRRLLGRSLAMEVHERYGRLLRQEWMAGRYISPIDLALLVRHQAGQPTKVIARAMGLTPRAVDMRFYKLNVKLGVRNRRAAVQIAIEHGLI